MTVFKCKMCGGNLDVQEGMTLCKCKYCDSVQTVPRFDNDKGNKFNLFSRANRLRSAGEFDKASGVYETIISEFPEEAEAYWGLLLCKYGIEYVDDPGTHRKIPTCHRSSFDSIMEDPDFEMVMECSEPASRAIYREEAKAIEALRIAINAVSSQEAPYDIFICYKETDDAGSRTIDSVIAQDVYTALVEKGYRVFFSRISLEDKLGEEYEPYIFAALNSAKIMLAFGTDYEYFNAVWVKNEWSRFLGLIEKGAKKTLIPCYKGIDAYDMPKEFARLQAQDMGKVGAIQDLLRGIDKIMGAYGRNDAAEPVVVKERDLTKAGLIKRMFMFIADNDFSLAEKYAEKVLDIDPENGEAYLAKALIDLQISNLGLLSDVTCFENNPNTRKALRYGSDTLRNDILGFIASFKTAEKLRQKAEEERKRQEEIAAQKAAEKIADTFQHLDRAFTKRSAPAITMEMSSIQPNSEDEGDWTFGQAMQMLLSNPRIVEIVCEKNLKQVTTYNGFLKVVFGRYPQSPEGRLDDIEWLVLKREGNKVLFVSKDALDFGMYSETGEEVSWERSSLRRWLNEVFVSSAFRADEARLIVSADVTGAQTVPRSDASAPSGAPSNQGSAPSAPTGTPSGKGIFDKIFLLSSVEANLYLNSYRARACRGTAYCAGIARSSRGAVSGRAPGGKNDDTFPCTWWLRTPRAYVSSDGTVNYGGRSVFTGANAVRPAMWIDLEA